MIETACGGRERGGCVDMRESRGRGRTETERRGETVGARVERPEVARGAVVADDAAGVRMRGGWMGEWEGDGNAWRG